MGRRGRKEQLVPVSLCGRTNVSLGSTVRLQRLLNYLLMSLAVDAMLLTGIQLSASFAAVLT